MIPNKRVSAPFKESGEVPNDCARRVTHRFAFCRNPASAKLPKHAVANFRYVLVANAGGSLAFDASE
jgi:hypothetical protein